MTERAIEAAARPLRWKLADAISFAVTGTYGHASDYLVEADAALSVIAALAEDDAAVEKVARALCALANPPESLIDPADHSEFVRTEAIGYRADARAAIRAMGGE